MKTAALVCLLVPLAACSKSESKPKPEATTTVAVAPPEPTTVAPPPVVLPPARIFAEGADASIDWDVDGKRFAVAILPTVLRVSHGDTHHDFEVFGGDKETLQIVDQAVVYRMREFLVYKPETLYGYTAFRIEWDASANKPTITQRWTCDEVEIKTECVAPAWAGRDSET